MQICSTPFGLVSEALGLSKNLRSVGENMNMVQEYAWIIHCVSVLSFLLMYMATTQVSSDNQAADYVMRATGLSLPYAIYVMVRCKEDDPRYAEVDAFKKIGIVFLVSAPISGILLYLK